MNHVSVRNIELGKRKRPEVTKQNTSKGNDQVSFS